MDLRVRKSSVGKLREQGAATRYADSLSVSHASLVAWKDLTDTKKVLLIQFKDEWKD
jgi:hypothetical protein